MAKIPQYVLGKDILPRLSDAMREVSLDVQPFSQPKNTAQGTEQLWMCNDEVGQLFSFSILEVNDKNVFNLKSGTVCLEIGPHEKKVRKRTHNEVSEAFERFERALIVLGARRMQ